MERGPTYKVDYRRKRKGLTNYKKRLKLLKSGKVRLVVRKSNNAIICQMIEYAAEGDKVVVEAKSFHLIKLGYKGHTANIPASYLTGYMCGLKAKKKGIKEAVLDTGLYVSTKGSRIYAALKGVLDAGIVIPFDEKIMPQERQIKGAHMVNYARILKAEKPEKYEKLFSNMISKGFEPEKIAENIEEVKTKISRELS